MFALEKTIHGHANHYPGPRGEDGDGYIPAAWVPLKDTKTRAKESQLHGAHRSEEHMMDEFQKALRPHHHNFPVSLPFVRLSNGHDRPLSLPTSIFASRMET